MNFSRATQYAIRALAYLAVHSPNALCPLEKIASDEGIPQSFLGKVLQGLAHKKIVRSTKGINGGYGLGLPAEKITLYSVVDAIDNLSVTQADCVLGRSVCDENNPCPLHNYWKAENERRLEFMSCVTLRMLCDNGGAAWRKKRVSQLRTKKVRAI